MCDPTIEDLLSVIKRELALLSVQLNTYQALFSVEQDCRAALISDTAPEFFTMVQMALFESILMRTSRLMDPPGSAGKRNASFAQLFGTYPNLEAQRPSWTAILNAWDCEGSEVNAVKRVRNKFIGHNDQCLWLDRDTNEAWIPISEGEFAALTLLCRQLWDVFRRVHLKLFDSDLIEAGLSGESPTLILRHLACATFLEELLERRGDLLDENDSLSSHITMAVGDERPQPALGQGA